MRKLFSFLSIAILSLAFVSCENKQEFDDNGFTDVYPGLLLLDHAYATNAYAMDGISVATRFAILQGEMEAEGLSFNDEGKLVNSDGEIQTDWEAIGTYEFETTSQKINKKYILFSANKDGGKITRLPGSTTAYTVSYGNEKGEHTQGAMDNILRQGTYIIETNGVKLTETDASNMWEVYIKDDKMTFAVSTKYPSVANIKIDNSETSDEAKPSTTIYMSNGATGEFTYSSQNFNGYYNNKNYGEEKSALWSVDGKLTIDGIKSGEDLTVENTIEETITCTTKANGTTLDQTKLTYETLPGMPFKYVANTTFLRPCGGKEFIQKFNKETHALEETVTREFFSDGTTLVEYNGFKFPNNLEDKE